MSTEKIAGYIVDTKYEQIPDEAVDVAKKLILDTLGVALAGCNEPVSKLITEYVNEEESRPEAGVIGGGFRTLASQAAWVNGTIAHALDYDDWCVPFGGHPSVAILPAVLALGEKHQASGKDILLSYITGFEAATKIGPVCLRHYMIGWHMTGTMGTIGAVSAAAKLLKLDIEETRTAIGIAASLAGGLKQNIGTMTKPLHAGNAARNGIVAALLAQRGFTADKSILEAPQGYCKVLGGGVDLELSKIGEGLGERYDIVSSAATKPWPSCADTHTSIEIVLQLRKEHNIKPEEVDEIEVRTGPVIPSVAFHSRPQTALEGKFSMNYCVARALLDGEVGLQDFTDERVRQPEVQQIIPTVRYVDSPELASDLSAVLGSEVVIKLRDGRTFSRRQNSPKGSASNPMSWDDVCAKYWDCASLILPARDVQTCMEMVSHLESLSDINSLMDILTFTRKETS